LKVVVASKEEAIVSFVSHYLYAMFAVTIVDRFHLKLASHFHHGQ